MVHHNACLKDGYLCTLAEFFLEVDIFFIFKNKIYPREIHIFGAKYGIYFLGLSTISFSLLDGPSRCLPGRWIPEHTGQKQLRGGKTLFLKKCSLSKYEDV
jgi:hypothetical protein